jgi:DNA-binding Lrp family transcriptional regulator
MSRERNWSFLSHHGMVLVALARQADLRLRDLAAEVSITPRAVQTIVTDLVRDGFLERTRVGRRNRYRVRGDRELPDPWAEDRKMGDLVRALARRRPSPGSDGRRNALVLACSDHRFQPGLRQLFGRINLESGAEVVLWPGGSTALTEPGGSVLLELIAAAVDGDPPARIVLVSHEGCRAESRAAGTGSDPFRVVAEASRRRRRTVELVQGSFGLQPELWYQTARGIRRMGGARPSQAEVKAV